MSATFVPKHERQDSSMSLTSGNDDLFASLAGYDDFNGDDDSFDDDEKDGLGELSSSARKSGKKLASTAEKKATHNAVERARRESLNARFLVLADLLPGMNHIKRASKAAIVNKSIELIKDLQSSETRLSKENDSLKQELASLRAHFTAMPPLYAMQAPAHHLAAIQPAVLTPSPAIKQQKQQQAAPAERVQTPMVPAFNHMFAHGQQQQKTESGQGFGVKAPSAETVRSESGSPSSLTSSLPAPPSTAASSVPSSYPSGSAYLTGGVTTGSPLSYSSHSPSNNTVTTANNNNAGTAPSPASSQSVPTPGNAYSPSFGNDTGNASPAVSHANGHSVSAAAVAAFNSTGANDAAYLAANFGPRDLAKAQQELQNFLAYQQRIASNPSVQGSSAASFMAGAHAAGLGSMFHQFPNSNAATAAMFAAGAAQSHPPAQNANPSSFCASPTVGNVPAWQMMMAQQAALTAYGGSGQF